MGTEQKPNKQIVLGRNAVSQEQQPFTIEDRIRQMETWRDNSQAQAQRESLQKRIDRLTEEGNSHGMDTPYETYLSQKSQKA